MQFADQPPSWAPSYFEKLLLVIGWQIHLLGSHTQGEIMLSEENQKGRRPDNRELDNVICWSQQNEIN